MVQNIPLAIVLQTIGSFCFALAANLQHHAVGQEVEDNHEKQRMSFADLWESVKSPRWLLGLGCMGISLALQVTALVFAPVSVVQPVGLLAFPWSMVLQARAAKHRVPYRIMSAVAATVGATLAFTVIVSLYASPETDLVVSHVFVGAAVVYATALILGTLGSRGPLQWRSLFWASGGAVFYGLEAALVKSLIEFVKYHDWLHDPAFWGIVAALVAGSATAGWMVQQGYATGPAEIVVASMTITSPVVAVVYGIAVLGEGTNYTPFVAFMMLLLGVCAVGGVVKLTQLHHALETNPDALND